MILFEFKLFLKNFTRFFSVYLSAPDPSDQSITDGMMHVIWAVGQEPYDPAAASSTVTDTKSASPSSPNRQETLQKRVQEFYRKGELNSHAHDAKNRGFWEVNLRTGAFAWNSVGFVTDIGTAILILKYRHGCSTLTRKNSCRFSLLFIV